MGSKETWKSVQRRTPLLNEKNKQQKKTHQAQYLS